MLPSGRSAMIWTVQPSAADTRTRTNRYPSCSITGSCNTRNPRGQARLDNEPYGSLAGGACGRACLQCVAYGHLLTKKRAGPGGPHFKTRFGYEGV